ncbi:unnamed protein product [Paramecium sonneborni]|uniref:Uncharacterized protein n=1 Tax=Paramecium sonneborni TaxID=65129 RepID=A0A8S1R014_9CILI|nr:unnamed protein product [Paramecium sonneborni]
MIQGKIKAYKYAGLFFSAQNNIVCQLVKNINDQFSEQA